jgi:glycosyltransferase involved in cell wall biosynthesis
LRRCIDSVAGQTYPNKELIVVDGGSTDGTVDILEAENDKIAYWESKPDRGIYHAWNKALKYAEGEWICFLGADDYFATPDSLSELSSELEVGTDFIFGRIAIVDENDRILTIYGPMWNWERMKRYQVVSHAGALHHRSVFERYGKFDEKYRVSGDYEFFLRVGAAAKTSYVPKVIVHFKTGGVSQRLLRRTFRENRQIQSVHPEIGPYRAWTNYAIAECKALLRMLRRML